MLYYRYYYHIASNRSRRLLVETWLLLQLPGSPASNYNFQAYFLLYLNF